MLPFHHQYHQSQPPAYPQPNQPYESDDGEGEWEDSISSSRGSSHSGSGEGSGSGPGPGRTVRYNHVDEEDEVEGISGSFLNSRSSSASVLKGGFRGHRLDTGRAGMEGSMGIRLGQGEGRQGQQEHQQVGRSFKGCAMCRKSKVKCGEEKPGCARCVRRGIECKYVQKAPQPAGRVRRHHQRSTAGCSTCRSRRVKCDEVGPICGPCSKRGCPCGFSPNEAVEGAGNGEQDKQAKMGEKTSKRPVLRPAPSYPPFTSRSELRSGSVGLGPRSLASGMATMTERVPMIPLPLMLETPLLSPDGLNKNTGMLLTAPDLGAAGFPLLPVDRIRGYEPILPTPPLTGFPPPYNPLDMPLPNWTYNHTLTTQSAPTTSSSTFTTPPEDEDRSYFSGSGCLMGGDEPVVQGWSGGPGDAAEVDYLAGTGVHQVDPMGSVYPATGFGAGSAVQHGRTGSRLDDFSGIHRSTGYMADQNRLQGPLILEPSYREDYAEAVHPRNAIPAYQPFVRSGEYLGAAPQLDLLATQTDLLQDPEPQDAVDYVGDIRLLPTSNERLSSIHPDNQFLPTDLPVLTVERQSRVLSKRYREEEQGQVIVREKSGPLGRWEPDANGRLQPVVVTSKIDSYAMIPPPALPFTIIPPAFAELLELCPKSVMGMPTDFLMSGLGQEVTLVKEIDPLSTFFPLVRDRVIYRHFISQTASTMIAMADHDHLNPWTRHFAKLALGVPPGISTAQDAFRSALLSLSAYDLGYRITMATGMTRADVHRNPIVKLSQEFWDETKTLLDCIVDEVQTPFSLSVDDLSLAACVALSHRDRLSASGQWLYSLEYAAEMINTLGGAGTFLSLSPTLIRRFLLEQMVCIDVFGSFFTIDAPLICEPRSAWWESPFSQNSPRSLTEHIEIVFGVDRPMIDYLARVMTLTAIGRHGAMKSQGISTTRMARVSDQEVEDGWASFAEDKKALLVEAEQIAIETISRPYPARIAAGRIAWKNCVVMWLNIDAQNSKAQFGPVKQGVKQVLETVVESLGRGMVTHLCLPFCFAAYNARDEDRLTVERILDMLEPYGRMDWTTLNRCIRFVWDCLDAPQSSVKLKNWRQLYDDEGLFLSYI